MVGIRSGDGGAEKEGIGRSFLLNWAPAYAPIGVVILWLYYIRLLK